MVKKYGLNLSGERHPIMVAEETYTVDDEYLNSPEKIDSFCRTALGLDRRAEEFMYLFCLDCKNRLLGLCEVSHGTVNAALVGTREIFIRALMCGAVNIVLVHSHPSGMVIPSKEDDEVCRNVRKTGQLINIPLIDFIIVGDSYFSYREEEHIV